MNPSQKPEDAENGTMCNYTFACMPMRRKNGWALSVALNPDHLRRNLDDTWCVLELRTGENAPMHQANRIANVADDIINGMIKEATGVDGSALKRQYSGCPNNEGRDVLLVFVEMLPATAIKMRDYAYEHHCPKEPRTFPAYPITDREIEDTVWTDPKSWPGCDLVD